MSPLRLVMNVQCTMQADTIGILAKPTPLKHILYTNQGVNCEESSNKPGSVSLILS